MARTEPAPTEGEPPPSGVIHAAPFFVRKNGRVISSPTSPASNPISQKEPSGNEHSVESPHVFLNACNKSAPVIRLFIRTDVRASLDVICTAKKIHLGIAGRIKERDLVRQ
jgi:hypothetical protein